MDDSDVTFFKIQFVPVGFACFSSRGYYLIQMLLFVAVPLHGQMLMYDIKLLLILLSLIKIVSAYPKIWMLFIFLEILSEIQLQEG